MNRFKIFKIFCFVLSVAAALYYPVKKVIQYEFTPCENHVFEVHGYDPYDYARGRYLALGFQELPKELKSKLSHNKKNYAVVKEGKDGFSVVSEVIHNLDGRACTRLSKRAAYSNVIYPFSRFYINEELAPAAESVFKQALKSRKRCALVVSLYPDGASAVRDLLVDGVSIRVLAQEEIGR